MVNTKMKNEITSFGVRCTAPGFIKPEDARAWFEDLKRVVAKLGKSRFGLLVDIRGQLANPAETTQIIQDAMMWLKKAGVERSAVVLDNSVMKIQITRLAKTSGVYAWERYFDAADDAAWESKALEWINAGIDPDQK